jgi:hypothetical protein
MPGLTSTLPETVCTITMPSLRATCEQCQAPIADRRRKDVRRRFLFSRLPIELASQPQGCASGRSR